VSYYSFSTCLTLEEVVAVKRAAVPRLLAMHGASDMNSAMPSEM